MPGYIISKEIDESFEAMDKAIRDSDIMDASYFWKITAAFMNGDITFDNWDKKIGDNICEHLTKRITEELKKQGKI
jgi:hypothetical protein